MNTGTTTTRGLPAWACCCANARSHTRGVLHPAAQPGDQVSINLAFKHPRVKIYLKDDRGLRVETVINDTADLGLRRGLDHLDQLRAAGRAINTRMMDAIRVGQGAGVLASPVFGRIARPTRTADGRRVPAMRFGDPRMQALGRRRTAWCGPVSLPLFTPSFVYLRHTPSGR